MSSPRTPAEKIESFIVGVIAALIVIAGIYFFIVKPAEILIPSQPRPHPERTVE